VRYKGFHKDIRKLHLIITLLAAFTLYVILQTLILAHEYRQSMASDVVSQFYTLQINVAHQTAAGIEKFFADILSDLDLLAQYPQMQLGQPRDVDFILRQFYRKDQNDVVHLFRLNREGIMTDIVPASDALGESFAYRAYFQQARDTLQPYVSRFMQVREHYWTLVLAHPILIPDPQADLPVFGGLVAATVSVDEIRNRFFKGLTVGQTGYGWMMDGEGNVIIHPVYPELEGQNVNAILEQEGMGGMDRLAARIRDGNTEVEEYAHRGLTKYAAFSPFRLGNQVCYVAVCAPIDEVKGFMQATFGRERILLVFVILALGGAGLSAMLFVRRIHNYRMEERSRTHLMQIFQAMHDGVCIIGPDYRLETINPALVRNLGLDLKSPLGRPCYEVFMKQSQPCTECPLEETWNRGGPAQAYKQMLSTTGQNFASEVFTLPLSRSGEERPHVFCYVKALTTETSLKHKLTQSRKLATLGEVAAGIAHEMRNPLISIRSASEMLLESPNHDEDEQTLAKIIHKESGQLEHIIRELLAYAQPARIERTRVQLNDIVNEVMEDVRHRKDFGPPLKIRVHTAEDLPEAYLDRTKIKQMLWNLLVNARDAVSPAGTIRVLTQWEASGGNFRQKHLLLVVEDTGKGFDEVLTEEIFKPFFTTKAEGLGMGLALVQQIVEAHDGDIQVESVPGEGSRFAVRLPLIS